MPNLDGFEAALAIRALEATAYSDADNSQRDASGVTGDELPSRPTKQRRVATQPVTGAELYFISHTRFITSSCVPAHARQH